MNLTGYQSNRPVNRSNRSVNRSNRPVNRSEPVEHAILNLNLNLTGFRPNRSGIPVPDPAGMTGPVGKLNPACGRGTPLSSPSVLLYMTGDVGALGWWDLFINYG